MKIVPRRRMAAIIAVILSFFIISADVSPRHGQLPSHVPAKNIILLIGDGMGMEVISLLHDYARICKGRSLHLERLMQESSLALVHPAPLDKLVTDSSAAATAIATGKKTLNGMVAITPDGVSQPTILELARNASKSTGIVTTTSLSHATPASFAAHAEERKSEAEIADHMLSAGITVMMGGGLSYWIPQGHRADEFASLTPVAGASAESEREDSRNLLAEASAAGFHLIYNRHELLAVSDVSRLLGLFAWSHLPYALDREPADAAGVPSLAEMTDVALNVLSKNENGFFLMVEGGRIDHAAHNHDVAAMLADALDFDDAIGKAYAFARNHTQTAVFVTADHATGAPTMTARYVDSLDETLYPDEETMKKIERQDASFETLLSLLATKSSPERLQQIVAEHAGIQLSKAQARQIVNAGPLTAFHVVKPKYRRYAYLIQALARVLGEQYMTAWATAEHYSEPVVFISYGVPVERAGGYLDQTEIFDIIKAAGGF